MSDLISRQDAIDAVVSSAAEWDRMYIQDLNCRIRDAIKQLPSAEPKRGHWVGIDDEPYYEWECDVCGFVIDGSGCIDPLEYLNIYNYCPNCGTRMTDEDRTD